ncbi:MAG: TlpA disulfide reductase family protein [Planctomycetota bacterium]
MPAQAEDWTYYRAWLTSPGGELPFGLALPAAGAEERTALVRNGPELREVPVRWDGEQLHVQLPPYDSWIEAKAAPDGRLAGQWTKRRGTTSRTEMAFHATPGAAPRFGLDRPEAAAAARFVGRWRVQFEGDKHPSVALIDASWEDGTATGTFLTTLGDYRFLAGEVGERSLRLSCFDGAHAFLFAAELQPDGSLRGDFWSSNTWHETWTAHRDDQASLPDAFELTTAQEFRWGERPLSYPDPDGQLVDLAELRGPATLIYCFGTWCPNCSDAGAFLGKLLERHRDAGLRVIGLAFEHDDEPAARAERVRAYRDAHGLQFPVLLVGSADKSEASRAFPLVDRVRAFPTTLFLDAAGAIRAVHTGFSGPATGAAHDELAARFEAVVKSLLDEAPQRKSQSRARRP